MRIIAPESQDGAEHFADQLVGFEAGLRLQPLGKLCLDIGQIRFCYRHDCLTSMTQGRGFLKIRARAEAGNGRKLILPSRLASRNRPAS